MFSIWVGGVSIWRRLGEVEDVWIVHEMRCGLRYEALLRQNMLMLATFQWWSAKSGLLVNTVIRSCPEERCIGRGIVDVRSKVMLPRM